MLNGGREGLFQLGQQLQQQGEYQAALHCFLSSLLGLRHVQSFTSLPNCLHQHRISMFPVDSARYKVKRRSLSVSLAQEQTEKCQMALLNIAELFISENNYGKALQFIQAEKLFYEVALIELTAVQGSTGPQEEALLGSAGTGWASSEELSDQASQAQHLEQLAQLCIVSKRPHLALEYSGKATKIHQRAFGNDHPITDRSLELLATVYAEIGKTEYSDSLGQCVSVLSKRFAAAESFGDKLNNGLPHSHSHSHREKHSEVWHRKDPSPQDDTPKPKVTNGKIPTSILKRSGSGSDSEPSHRRKGKRQVRFREPETTVHAYDTSPPRPHLALFTCLFLLMSLLGVVMYSTDRRRPQRVCEELEASLAVYLIHMKQLLWGCWIWLTMQ
ncbi:uncharacterized protein isoform X2 [Salmo salar]|uniref:Uncharacterized protein isoform X2 n=1 Tax=Salmo salar TaxID=8030 RepID=A0A1S3SPL0_SALSA|nr:uncharacterized protein LOC106611011 isoform X2 [Salmo salar]|eukprot:XP_014066282.1 PREDICTED: uncharacterized protein LOC106611011 isoform X2 [Salmo salar]